MEIGDKVEVIRTPYDRIKNGTKGTIVDIKFREFPKKWHLYILDTKPCNSFRAHEIRRINSEK